MTYRVDRDPAQMATALGKTAERYNNDALTFANQYGIAINPRNVDPDKMAAMREKRQDNIRNALTSNEITIKSKWMLSLTM